MFRQTDVSYFFCFTRGAKDIEDVCTQANGWQEMESSFLLVSVYNFQFTFFVICLSAVIYIRIQDPRLVNQPSAMTVLAESAKSVIGQLQAITVQPDAIAARCGLTLNAAV